MADNARKAVETAVLDTWTRGSGVAGIIATDKNTVTRGGDSVDIPELSAMTVNRSHTAAVASSVFTQTLLQVVRELFINQGVTFNQRQQLLNGNDAAAREIARRALGDMDNERDKDLIDYCSILIGGDATKHINLDLSSTDYDDLVNEAEAIMREQDGIRQNDTSSFAWLASPRASRNIKSTSSYYPGYEGHLAERGKVGFPNPSMLNEIPYFQHSGVPGALNATRLSATGTASSVSSNVVTVTVSEEDASKFVVGQLVWTSGFTADVAVGSPTAITAKTSTTLSFALTAGDGANGTGTVYSASSMAFLVYKPWYFYADTGVPMTRMVEREGSAGHTLQMAQTMGRIARAGAVVCLHMPD